MPDTFVKIATVTVGFGGASTIDFTSIPQTYTDLCLKVSVRTNQSAVNDDAYLQFNGDTGANYSFKRIYGSGSGAGSDGASNNAVYGLVSYWNGGTSTSSTFSNGDIYIPNYAGSTSKSFSVDSVAETNGTTQYMDLVAGIWSGTAAITSIKLQSSNAATIQQYSTATLYGIKKD